VRWTALLALLVACHDDSLEQHLPNPPAYTYAPAHVGWPLPKPMGHLGRTQAPQVAIDLGVRGPALSLLVGTSVWSVPGGRALVSGTIADGTKRHAIEMIDIDGGTQLWRDTLCDQVMGVTDTAIICGSKPVRGISFDGKPLWVNEQPYESMTGERIAVGNEGHITIIEAATGRALSDAVLPGGVHRVYATCGAEGRELFVYLDGKLDRILGATPKIAWTIEDSDLAIDTLGAASACEGDTILVMKYGTPGGLLAISRETGKTVHAIADAQGWWPARDGSANIEVSTTSGITLYPRDLSAPIGPAPGAVPGLGALVATRGDKRLVRATEDYAVLLDKQGVAAFLPLRSRSAALGERAIVAPLEQSRSVYRFAIPERIAHAPRILAPSKPVALAAELRDTPTATPIVTTFETGLFDLDLRGSAAAGVAFAPTDPATLFVVTPSGESERGNGLLAFDLRTKKERWRTLDTCGDGDFPAIAVTHDLVVCGNAFGDVDRVRPAGMAVTAYSHEGHEIWWWKATAAVLLGASGDLVMVSDGHAAYILDAANGRVLFELPTHLVEAVPDPQWGTVIISAERDRLVARTERAGFLPMWSLAVDGSVLRLERSGESVLVTLADGDAYLVRAATGAITPLPAIGQEWYAFDDELASLAPSSPAFRDVPLRAAPIVTPKPASPKRAKADSDEPLPPRLWEPIPVPTDGLTETGQLTFYDATGAIRARNDYLMAGYSANHRDRRLQLYKRGAPGSPFVISGGPEGGSLLVLDPTTGEPVRHVVLDRGWNVPFSTIVDGAPITGAVAVYPLRVSLF
jgi:hypothetical protein